MLTGAQDSSLNDITAAGPDDMPTDTVSSIAWAPTLERYMFACSSWDSQIRIYDVQAQGESAKALNLKVCLESEEPCLSVTWSEDLLKLYAGCIDNTVKVFDLETGKSQDVGMHEAAVKDVHYLKNENVVCSVSFDKTVRIWDLRQKKAASILNIEHKIFCSDLYDSNLIMGLSQEKILMINPLRPPSTLAGHLVNSPLGTGSQLTAISFFCDGSGIGVATHDGMAHLSNIATDQPDVFKLNNTLTFKCHSNFDQGHRHQTLYPVHAIGFNSKSKKFLYTAGGNNTIAFWDYFSKSKIASFSYKGCPTRAKTSPDGSMFVYALGYDYYQGIEKIFTVKPKICVHLMRDNEFELGRR